MYTDLRQACARLRHQPLFSGGVIVVLALAIGANTAIFTLVNAILIRPLPLRAPDRLVSIAITRPGTDRQPLSILDLADFKQQTRTLEGIASAFGWSANLTGSGDAERLQGMRVSSDYFELTGGDVELGRIIRSDDERERVALISHGVWQRKFGGAMDVVGRSLVLNGETFTIVGVLRPDFVALVREADVIAPFAAETDPRRGRREAAFLRAVGRMKEGMTLAQVVGDLDATVQRMRAEYPDAHGADTAVRAVLLQEDVSGRAAPMLKMLLGAVALLLLIACADLANLFLVRGTARRREIAVRAALGASRSRIVSQLLIEAAALGLAGGALGLLVARAFVDTLLAIGPSDLPRIAEIGFDLRIVVYTLAVSLAASGLFGVVPAVQAVRGDLHDGLKNGDRSAAPGGARLRRALIFAEVALSTVLLITSAVLARSFARVQAVDPGFRAPQVLTIRLSLPRSRYGGHTAMENFYERLHPRLAALAGIRAAAVSNVVPMNGYLATTAFRLDGMVSKDAPEAHYRMISPDYFRTLGIALRRGRVFTRQDRAGAAAVAIVNETFARQYWRGRDPVGTELRLDDGEKTPRLVEVVGVVGDVKHFGLDQETTIEVYVPIAQVPDPTTIWLANNMYVTVLTDGEPLAAANSVRREIAAVDPTVAASFVRSMDQWLGATLAPRRFTLELVTAFAAAALLLAVIGVYAVSAAAVASRTREIGIRAALGASRRELMVLVLRGAMAPVLLGLAAGSVAAPLTGGAITGMLFGITVRDPLSVGATAVALTTAALAASYLPARRAARVDPAVALQVE